MKIKIEFSCDNAAFGDDDAAAFCAEVSRILHEAADKFCHGHAFFPVRDVNGNVIGRAELEEF